MIAYLSGAMENARDEGSAWRNDLTDWLRKELGHDVIDPVELAAELVQKENADSYRDWKVTDPIRFRNIVRKMIARDLFAVKSESDYVICLWNEDVLKGGGTHGEVTTAYDHGIPVYLINQLPQEDLSGWIFSCSTEVFDDFTGLKKFLKSYYNGSKI